MRPYSQIFLHLPDLQFFIMEQEAARAASAFLASEPHKSVPWFLRRRRNNRDGNRLGNGSGRSRSYPALVPSQSILVRRISPAPRLSTFLAHSSASMPTSIRPHFYRCSAAVIGSFSWHRSPPPRTGCRTSAASEISLGVDG